MEISEFLDRARNLDGWKKNSLLIIAASHINAERKHGHNFAEETWQELEKELYKMENFEEIYARS